MRTRPAVSRIRAPIFRSLMLRVANLALAWTVGLWDGVAESEHQPVCGGVQNQAHLIGHGRSAGGLSKPKAVA